MSIYNLGAVPSPEDPRDFQVPKSSYKVLSVSYPEKYEVLQMQGIRHQQNEGTCVAHALANGVMGYFQRIKPTKEAPYDRTLSVRDLYEGARQIEPVNGEGSYPRAALKYAQRTGVCLEEDWKYIPQEKLSESPNAYKTRQQNRVASYARVNNTINDIKSALQTYGPLLIVVPVYESFYSPDVNGLVKISGKIDGYHAICIVGWDDNLGWKIRNSWGTDWGINGHCYIPFRYPITELWSVIPSLNNNQYEPPKQLNIFELIFNFIFNR